MEDKPLDDTTDLDPIDIDALEDDLTQEQRRAATDRRLQELLFASREAEAELLARLKLKDLEFRLRIAQKRNE